MVKAPFNLQPIGSGPYRFDRLIVENNLIIGVALSRFEETNSKKPFIDQVIFRYYPDAKSAYKAYEDGTVQGIGHVTPDILPQVLAQPDLSIYTGRMPELSLVMFNLNDAKSPFFQDARVRKALMSGLNRQWIVDRILGGQAIVADGPILPGTWAYYDGVDRLDYDSDQAKSLLKTAGYDVTGDTNTVRKKGDVELSFELLYPEDDLHKSIAEFIQKSWADLDIKVTISPVSYDVLVNQRLQDRSYQAALVDMNLMRTPDPDPYPFWDQAQATGGQNYSQWDNRIASEYLETARTTIDITERTRLYRNFQVVFGDDLPALPLYFPVYSYAVDKQVQGVTMGSIYDTSDRFLNVTDWYLIARRTSKAASPTAQP
jgi:peptide/nickel transport system substrate-binding protein